LFLRKNGAFFVKNNSAFCILHYALFIARQSDKLGFGGMGFAGFPAFFICAMWLILTGNNSVF